MRASCDLIKMLHGKVIDCVVLYAIPELNGRDNVASVTTLL